MSNQTLVSAAKEVGRLAIFSLPAALIFLITNSPEATGSWGVAALFFLRAWDKAIHENPKTASIGLLPF